MAVSCSLAKSKPPVNITLCSFSVADMEGYCVNPYTKEVIVTPLEKLDKFIMMSPKDFSKLEQHYQEMILRNL